MAQIIDINSKQYQVILLGELPKLNEDILKYILEHKPNVSPKQ